jgi:hypothetical protein
MGYRERLAETLPRLRHAIAEAALSAGRDPALVKLVAVTKGHPVAAVRAALEEGLEDLGENRVEELEAKVAEVGRAAARWHMIGHLQRRKVPGAVASADLIQSVDSLRLAERISRVAGQSGLESASVLLQVNTSGEEAKAGFPLEGALEALLEAAAVPGLAVRGLMTMAPYTDDERVLRTTFARLREMGVALASHRPGVGRELSMGMTNDLRIAVEEGSTMVRIGTALFGERIEVPT